jgi:hypothetical protein
MLVRSIGALVQDPLLLCGSLLLLTRLLYSVAGRLGRSLGWVFLFTHLPRGSLLGK